MVTCTIMMMALLVSLVSPSTTEFAKGIARPQAPPMGWRSWNFFQCNISQPIMEAQMDALVLPRHGSSLRKLGYNHVGLDDCWQSCTPRDMHCLGSAVGCSFHDSATGQPLINTTNFPALGGMVDRGHSLELKVGFYQNNCRCHECKSQDTCWGVGTHYAQDANLTVALDFDGVKIDSCGNQRDMTEWAAAFAQLAQGGRDLLVESCGNGPRGTSPKDASYTGADHLGLAPSWEAMVRDTCPFSFYRVSGDIAPQFFSAVANLNRALPYLRPEAPLSRPGCWAYPDMLEVAVSTPHGAMTHTESRTHFGMWAITSSPLILGFDLDDAAVVEANWDIIANTDVINVSQTYAGHPGYLAKSASETFVATCVGWSCENLTLPEYQIWAKPQPRGQLAVLVVNIGASGGLSNLTVPLSELYHPALFAAPGAPARVQIRDLWKHADVIHPRKGGGKVWTELVVPDVKVHDGMFVLLTPVA